MRSKCSRGGSKSEYGMQESPIASSIRPEGVGRVMGGSVVERIPLIEIVILTMIVQI